MSNTFKILNPYLGLEQNIVLTNTLLKVIDFATHISKFDKSCFISPHQANTVWNLDGIWWYSKFVVVRPSPMQIPFFVLCLAQKIAKC